MHANPSIANISQSGSRLDIKRGIGIASVIDASIGHYTLVFDVDQKSRDYVAVMTSDERGIAQERLDIDRTKSELPIVIKNGQQAVDAGVNIVVYG